MRIQRTIFVAVLTTLLLGGQTPAPLERDLASLTKRGFTFRILDNGLIELTDPASGEKHLKSLREPNETTIRAWAASRGIPILEIDPNTIDTSQYRDWYTYWTTVPLGNSIGISLVVGDVNHNGQADMYGIYKDTLSFDYEARLYEVDTLGNVLLRYQYVPRPGVSRQFADVDRDSNVEVVWSYAGIVSGYEQSSQDSLPIYRIYEHERYYHNSSPGYTGIHIGDLDGDSFTDFLYQGTGPHPKDTNSAISKTYVAEFDDSLQTFMRVWSTQFYPNSGANGFAVGDFDGGGRQEFVATHASGNVYVAENTGDNEYTMVWQDSTPFVNFYDMGSGDVDGDTKIEFFTGAVMSDGSWTLVYEADSNNAYSAKFLFHLLSGGLLAGAQYITADIDGDGKLELAIKVGGEVYVFKLNADNSYYLWYLRREEVMDAVTFYDFNNDGRQDIIVSRFVINPQGRGRFFADLYKATSLVHVNEYLSIPTSPTLRQNYPNPFNPNTIIEYSLPNRDRITLKIYNILGQEIETLLNEEKNAGWHTAAWNAEGVSSGIYFCRLEVNGLCLTKKLILIR